MIGESQFKELAYTKIQEMHEAIQTELMDKGILPNIDLGMLSEQCETEFVQGLMHILDTAITNDFKVNSFMTNIPHVAKSNYMLVTAEDAEFDIKVFELTSIDDAYMQCEMCDGNQGYRATMLIGTADEREPKFCFPHYKEINRDSKFVWVGSERP
jgi:hypothetical protein